MKSEHKKKKILLKFSGQVLANKSGNLDLNLIVNLSNQLKSLKNDFYFAIVIGGGNFFRGASKSEELKISEQISHYVGMLATCMNGLILYDIFMQNQLKSSLLSDINSLKIGQIISFETIQKAICDSDCLIFSGGIGNPFFTTDTTAIIRALQIEADEVWKCTDVDGIYTKDPHKFPDAKFLNKISHKEAIDQELKIMDTTAFCLARQHKLPIRIFNIFSEKALIKAAYDIQYGSIVC